MTECVPHRSHNFVVKGCEKVWQRKSFSNPIQGLSWCLAHVSESALLWKCLSFQVCIQLLRLLMVFFIIQLDSLPKIFALKIFSAANSVTSFHTVHFSISKLFFFKHYQILLFPIMRSYIKNWWAFLSLSWASQLLFPLINVFIDLSQYLERFPCWRSYLIIAL